MICIDYPLKRDTSAIHLSTVAVMLQSLCVIYCENKLDVTAAKSSNGELGQVE